MSDGSFDETPPFNWWLLRRGTKGAAAIGPDAILAAVVICFVVLLVAALTAAGARQLGPGRQRTPLAPPPPGGLNRPLPPPTSDDPDFPPPLAFRQYELSELARGGVGTVFRAVHPQTGKVYAIKQLNRQFVTDQLVIDAFHAGATMLRELRHPSIVRVYYDWTERNDGWHDHFVIMEYLPGNTLHDLIREQAPLRPDDRFRDIVERVGDVIGFLHSHSIVHRDIKPENFRLAGARYKLLDFDTAISRAHRGLVPQDGMPVGTPEYMAPEQARGSADIDTRADIYSFGMLLYELLTATVPFTGAPSRVLIDQMETPPRHPRTFNPELPDQLCDVIMMALQKQRDRRFQSIQAMIVAIRNALGVAGTPSAADEEGAPR